MLKSEAAAYLAGVTQTEGAEASAPTNLHIITGEVGETSENGKALIKIDGLVFSESDDQYIEIDALGGLEEGDIATLILAGEQGHGMTPLAIGSIGSVDRITVRIAAIEADYIKVEQLEAATARIGDLEADHVSTDDLEAATARIGTLETTRATITDLEAATARIHSLEVDHVSIDDFEAEQANIDQLQADTADIGTIRANSAKVQNLTAAQLEADHATIGSLSTNYAHITNGVIDNATIGYADVNNLSAHYAEIQNGKIDSALINTAAIVDEQVFTVTGNKATLAQIDAAKINVLNLKAQNIEVERINGQPVSGKTLVDALTQHESDISDLDSKIDDEVEALNERIDGAIETFTGTVVPTLENTPASQWNTDALKDQHVGDVYYVVNSQSAQNGYCYRFTKSGSTYSWQLIKDSDVTAALSRLQTAEGKIGDIETFDETVGSFMTNTNDEISSLKTKDTQLETSLGDKVSTSTFNTVSQKVDANEANITSMSTVLTNNGLTSSTNITNTVNTVRQTAETNTSNISSLQTTVSGHTTTINQHTTAIQQNTTDISLRATKTEVQQVRPAYATSTTGAGTAAKVATIDPAVTGYALYKGATVSVTFSTANTAATPTLNVNSTGAKQIRSYTGAALSEGEYKWAAGSTIDLVYDGTYWRMQDSGAVKRVTAAEASISVNAENIESKVSKDGVISSINQSAETVKIQASKVEINGTAIFTAISSDVDNAITSKGYATTTQAQGYATTAENNAKAYTDALEIGGRNLLQGITKTFPKNGTLNTYFAEYTVSNGSLPVAYTLEEGVTYTFSADVESSVEPFQVSIGAGTGSYSRDVIQKNGLSNGRVSVTFTPTATQLSSGTTFAFRAPRYATATNFTYSVNYPKLEHGDKATDWTPAPEDQTAYVDESVSSIQVGSRNLFAESQTLSISKWTYESGATRGDNLANLAANTSSRVYQMPAKGYWSWEANTKYVVSVEAKASASGGKITFNMVGAGVQTTVDITTEWQRYSWSFVSGATVSTGSASIYNSTTTGTVQIRKPKLEKGNKATDWTPAPEDIEASAVKRTQRIWYRTNASSAPATPGTASSNWVTKADDGNDAWTKMHIAISSTHKYIYTCEQYEMANGTVGYTSVLLDNTITVIDGGNIITGSVTANKLNAANINASKTLTVGAMTDAAASTILNSNVQIGGRNLLGNTENRSGSAIVGNSASTSTFGSIGSYNDSVSLYSLVNYDGYSNAVSCATSTSTGNRGAGWYTKAGEIRAGETYTFSCRVKCSIATNVHTHTAWRNGSATAGYTGWTAGGTKAISANTWTDYSYTFVPNSIAQLDWEFFVAMCITGSSSGATYQIAHAKLEKGNKATDWTPAPEDQTEYVDDSVSSIQVGGRNLLLNTGASQSKTMPAVAAGSYTTWDPYTMIGAYNTLGLTTSDSITISFDWNVTGAAAGATVKIGTNAIPWEYFGVLITFAAGASSGHVEKTFAVSSGLASSTGTTLRARIDAVGNAITTSMVFTISNAKLEKGNKATDWTPAPEDQTAYVNETTYQSSQPNLSPFFSFALDNYYNASTSPDGYWDNSKVSYGTSLSDGWAHLSKNNTGSSTTWFTIYEHSAWRHAHGDLKGSTKYTVMIEFRNVTKSGNITCIGTCTHVSSWPSMFVGNSDKGNVAVADGVQYHIGTTVADPSSVTGSTCTTRTLITIPAGASIDCDIRISLYEGEYSGPYKPYSGDVLFATYASLAGTNESLTGTITDVEDLKDRFTETVSGQNQTFTQFQNELTSLRQDLDSEIQSRQKWLKFDSVEGLIIGAQDSPFQTVTTNTSQQFKSNGITLAETSGDEFVAPRMRSDQLLIGDWMWARRDNGNLSLKWIG